MQRLRFFFQSIPHTHTHTRVLKGNNLGEWNCGCERFEIRRDEGVKDDFTEWFCTGKRDLWLAISRLNIWTVNVFRSIYAVYQRFVQDKIEFNKRIKFVRILKLIERFNGILHYYFINYVDQNISNSSLLVLIKFQ